MTVHQWTVAHHGHPLGYFWVTEEGHSDDRLWLKCHTHRSHFLVPESERPWVETRLKFFYPELWVDKAVQ